MKRFIVIALTGLAVALGTAGTAQAHDRDCHRSSHRSYSYRSYSGGSCQPQYYRSYNSCPPTYYRSYNSCPPTYYRSYDCQPRYYSSPSCYRGSSFSLSVPGFGFFFRR